MQFWKAVWQLVYIGIFGKSTWNVTFPFYRHTFILSIGWKSIIQIFGWKWSTYRRRFNVRSRRFQTTKEKNYPKQETFLCNIKLIWILQLWIFLCSTFSKWTTLYWGVLNLSFFDKIKFRLLKKVFSSYFLLTSHTCDNNELYLWLANS